MKDKINPRSFTMTKFLLTLGLILNYTISLVSFIDVFKGNETNLLLSTKSFLIIQIMLLIFSLICFFVFFLVRRDINKKIEYKYNNKEKKLIYIICLLITLIFLITFINILMFTFLFEKIEIMIIILLVTQMIFGITISILESFSRLSEQVIVNQIWFKDESKNEVKKSKTKVLDKKEDFNPFMQEEDND
ncbi:hypothetical protein [Spiroplasma monobiae]|uniref:Transmembrane protein n=1 Tax=Spiroplasma monobiae MQ-1 TaxID=1336748 RepID=A0A2K9LY25_SPISQ|nr:hypothetical protein [Spiroplasma monobiae]AUM62634.1 hypothetical protein SMONO_v1c03850 [Spiroplasma monobiae MQ-1]